MKESPQKADESLLTIDERDYEDALEVAQKRVKFVDQIIQLSLSRLRPGDIVSMDGRPWINADGCYKIARLFGVAIKYHGLPQRVDAADKRGPYYYFILSATMSMKNGDSVDVIGNCSSRAAFFAKAHNEWRPIEDIDPLDILQTCQTNTDRKGLAKLLGLNNITWDDVAKYSGIKQTDVQNFSFKKTAKNATAAPTSAAVPNGASAPKAAAAANAPGTAAADQAPIADDSPSLQQQGLTAVKDWAARHGKTLSVAIAELTGGKKSIGLLSQEELETLVDRAKT